MYKKHIQTQRHTHWHSQKFLKKYRKLGIKMCKTHRSYKKNKKYSQVRHYESKTLKYQCVCFVLVIYYWTWGPALRVVCIHSETPLEKTDLSFTRGYQLGDSFCVRDTSLFPLPLPALRPQTCASLCRVPVSVSSYVC